MIHPFSLFISCCKAIVQVNKNINRARQLYYLRSLMFYFKREGLSEVLAFKLLVVLFYDALPSHSLLLFSQAFYHVGSVSVFLLFQLSVVQFFRLSFYFPYIIYLIHALTDVYSFVNIWLYCSKYYHCLLMSGLK